MIWLEKNTINIITENSSSSSSKLIELTNLFQRYLVYVSLEDLNKIKYMSDAEFTELKSTLDDLSKEYIYLFTDPARPSTTDILRTIYQYYLTYNKHDAESAHAIVKLKKKIQRDSKYKVLFLKLNIIHPKTILSDILTKNIQYSKFDLKVLSSLHKYITEHLDSLPILKSSLFENNFYQLFVGISGSMLTNNNTDRDVPISKFVYHKFGKEFNLALAKFLFNCNMRNLLDIAFALSASNKGILNDFKSLQELRSLRQKTIDLDAYEAHTLNEQFQRVLIQAEQKSSNEKLRILKKYRKELIKVTQFTRPCAYTTFNFLCRNLSLIRNNEIRKDSVLKVKQPKYYLDSKDFIRYIDEENDMTKLLRNTLNIVLSGSTQDILFLESKIRQNPDKLNLKVLIQTYYLLKYYSEKAEENLFESLQGTRVFKLASTLEYITQCEMSKLKRSVQIRQAAENLRSIVPKFKSIISDILNTVSEEFTEVPILKIDHDKFKITKVPMYYSNKSLVSTSLGKLPMFTTIEVKEPSNITSFLSWCVNDASTTNTSDTVYKIDYDISIASYYQDTDTYSITNWQDYTEISDLKKKSRKGLPKFFGDITICTSCAAKEHVSERIRLSLKTTGTHAVFSSLYGGSESLKFFENTRVTSGISVKEKWKSDKLNLLDTSDKFTFESKSRLELSLMSIIDITPDERIFISIVDHSIKYNGRSQAVISTDLGRAVLDSLGYLVNSSGDYEDFINTFFETVPKKFTTDFEEIDTFLTKVFTVKGGKTIDIK